MNVLVTGGGGNLGSWICDRLAQEGHVPAVLSRSSNEFIRQRGYEFIGCDLASRDQCRAVFAKRSFEAVVHLASANDFSDPDYPTSAVMVNVLGMRNLLDALTAQPPRHFVSFSTIHVYGALTGCITEQTVPAPRHDYGVSHLAGEEYVRFMGRTRGLPYSILRLSNAYGCPRHMGISKWNLVLNDLARMAWCEGVIRLNSNGQARRDFVWMGDVAETIVRLIARDAAPNETFNLSSGRSDRVIDVANSVADAYRNRLNRDVAMIVNEQDLSTHETGLVIENAKLSGLMPLEFQNRMTQEALAVFDFLGAQGIESGTRPEE